MAGHGRLIARFHFLQQLLGKHRSRLLVREFCQLHFTLPPHVSNARVLLKSLSFVAHEVELTHVPFMSSKNRFVYLSCAFARDVQQVGLVARASFPAGALPRWSCSIEGRVHDRIIDWYLAFVNQRNSLSRLHAVSNPPPRREVFGLLSTRYGISHARLVALTFSGLWNSSAQENRTRPQNKTQDTKF